MLASEDKKKALTSPSSVFKHPADVVACGDLSKAEKTAILKLMGTRCATAPGRHRGRHE